MRKIAPDWGTSKTDSVELSLRPGYVGLVLVMKVVVGVANGFVGVNFDVDRIQSM